MGHSCEAKEEVRCEVSGQSNKTKCVGLHIAALRGDWDYALSFQGELDCKITDKSETVLHIAAVAQQVEFVEKLVDRFKRMDLKTSDTMTLTLLEAENTNGNTALCYAAASGIVKIAKVMIDAYQELYKRNKGEATLLPNRGQVKPVLAAAMLGHGEMVKYLIQKTDINRLTDKDRVELFISCLSIDLYDVALRMLTTYPELAIARNESSVAALHELARKSSAFVPQTQQGWRKCFSSLRKRESVACEYTILVREFCKSAVNSRDLEKAETKAMTIIAQSLLLAAEEGNAEFVVELIRFDPDLLWKVDPHKGSIFHIATRYRHESVFSLIYEVGSIKDLIATNTVTGQNNLLHLAARLAPLKRLSVIHGPALQMQHELFWYNEVEKIVQPWYREMRNSKGKTPRDLFDEEHKELRVAGEKWVKETAWTSMVVGSLICAATFMAAFSGPANPLWKRDDMSFGVFSIFDALALFFASVSLVMFLSVMSSGFTDEDFLRSLPARLTIGVSSLYASVMAMMAAFLASVYVLCPLGWSWMCAVFLTCCALILYVALKNSVLIALIASLYSTRSMRSHKRLF